MCVHGWSRSVRDVAFLVFLMTERVVGIRDLLCLVGGGTLVSRDMKAQDQPVAGVRIMAAMEAQRSQAGVRSTGTVSRSWGRAHERGSEALFCACY